MPQEHQQWQHEQLPLDQAGQDQSGYMDGADQPLDMLSSDLQRPATEDSRGTLSFLGDKEVEVQLDSISLSSQPAPSTSVRPGYATSTSRPQQEHDIRQALNNLPAVVRQRVTDQASKGQSAGQKHVQNAPIIEMGLES